MGPISVPSGFSLVSSFGDTTLQPGQSTTFAVRFNATASGTATGTVSFGSNDADEDPFNFTVTATAQEPPAVQIIDNGDAAFNAVGEWTQWGGQGFQSDIHESLPGTGSDIATWTFSGLLPGEYRVAATWTHYSNRATNAPFTILDGTTPLSTVQVNQQLAPSEFSDAGAQLAVPGHGLRDHRQYAGGETERRRQRATQCRCDPTGKGCARDSGTQGSQTLVDGQSRVDFGSTEVGAAQEHDVHRHERGWQGPASERADQCAARVQSGLQLLARRRSPLGQSTTFVVQMDASEIGTPSGTVVFDNDDADENPFSFTVQGTVVAEAVKEIIDNGDPGFSAVGEWSRWTGQGFENDIDESLPGIGMDSVSWTFTDLPAGEYRVSATWTAFSNRASEAPFTIFDNTTSLATIEVNQQLAPSQFSDAGVNWHDLGSSYVINSGTLVVRLTDAPSGRVNADAIRVERVGVRAA